MEKNYKIGVHLSYLIVYNTIKHEQMFEFFQKSWQRGLAKNKNGDIICASVATDKLDGENEKSVGAKQGNWAQSQP